MDIATATESVGLIGLDMADIEQILPHRGCALVIHGAHIHGETRATGYFSVQAEDKRIKDHFGIMPGVLIAEFVHLTGAVLMMYKNREVIPVLNKTSSEVQNTATSGDRLRCEVNLNQSEKRTFTFNGVVYNQIGKRIAEVDFSGTAVPKKIFERQIGRG